MEQVSVFSNQNQNLLSINECPDHGMNSAVYANFQKSMLPALPRAGVWSYILCLYKYTVGLYQGTETDLHAILRASRITFVATFCCAISQYNFTPFHRRKSLKWFV